MKLILAGKWPALKPLPVFKYETKEYRASIEFDKAHGEWVCRKTSFTSNNVQEVRGALAELTMALPHGQTETLTESVAGQQEQELEKDANRRLQAILEWRERYRNGALYFELRDYLSESQQKEIDDCIRLSLTARQLQVNAKNIAYVFDVLSKAGGRLATLIDIGQRNKAQREANAGKDQAGFPPESAKYSETEATEVSTPAPTGALTPAPVERFIPRASDKSPAELIEFVFTAQKPTSPPEPFSPTTPQASPVTPPETHAKSQAPIEGLEAEARRLPPAASFRPPVRLGRVEPAEGRTDARPSRFHVPEKWGFQFPALAVAILFALISLALGFTVRRDSRGKHLRGAQDARPNVAAKLSASPDHPNEASSQSSVPPASTSIAPASPPAPALQEASPFEEKSTENNSGAASSAKVPAISNPPLKSKPSLHHQVSPWPGGSTGLLARNAGPLAAGKPTPLPKPVDLSKAARTATFAAPHPARLPAILVTPGHAGKPFRVSFPEKPITANASFAMTSQLSVLVSPQHGSVAAPMPARLQAAELVSFVWPRYPISDDPYGLAELIKVRATIGRLGQVTDIKFVSGSSSLLPATSKAIREWRYKPTLLNHRPVQAEQEITVEYRPPQRVSHLATQRLSPN